MSFLVDDLSNGLSSREATRQALRKAFLEVSDDKDEKAPAYPDRSTWGLLPEHQAGLQRAVGVMSTVKSAAP